MNAWADCLLVVILATAGGFLGWRCSKLPKGWWTLGYFVPFVPLAMMVMTYRMPWLEFRPSFSWLLAGHRDYWLCAFAIPLLFCTLLPRLTNRRLQVLVSICMTGMVCYYSLTPFLSHALARRELASLETNIDRNGVCHQSNGYTCGPAAAVTGLKRLGLRGEESTIALNAYTCNAVGTESDVLADTLNQMYGAQGLRCEYRVFLDLDDLKDAGITIAVVEYDWSTDHYVTVLEVTDSEVVVGDPLRGLVRYSHKEFGDIWRYTGVSMNRRSRR